MKFVCVFLLDILSGEKVRHRTVLEVTGSDILTGQLFRIVF
jgi:hypothetical protein